jgi:hypothetical protein
MPLRSKPLNERYKISSTGPEAGRNPVFFCPLLHVLLVCIRTELHKTVDFCSECFDVLSLFMSRLTTWLLIVGSYATTTGQGGVPEASCGPNWEAGLFSSVEQCDKDNSPQGSPPALQTLLAAKTVFVVADALVLDPTSKAVQTLKKALVKWGRFRLVDDAETADLIIVISEYSSSKPTRMERISEGLAIFAGGSTSCADPTPLWAVREVGPALGQRPTGKLVEDLEKELAKLERPVHASAAPSPIWTDFGSLVQFW